MGNIDRLIFDSGIYEGVEVTSEPAEYRYLLPACFKPAGGKERDVLEKTILDFLMIFCDIYMNENKISIGRNGLSELYQLSGKVEKIIDNLISFSGDQEEELYLKLIKTGFYFKRLGDSLGLRIYNGKIKIPSVWKIYNTLDSMSYYKTVPLVKLFVRHSFSVNFSSDTLGENKVFGEDVSVNDVMEELTIWLPALRNEESPEGKIIQSNSFAYYPPLILSLGNLHGFNLKLRIDAKDTSSDLPEKLTLGTKLRSCTLILNSGISAGFFDKLGENNSVSSFAKRYSYGASILLNSLYQMRTNLKIAEL